MIMSNFPWYGKTLFNGTYYSPNQLPLSYVPALFGIQFTEPVAFLFFIGLGIFIFRFGNDRLILILQWSYFSGEFSL